MGAHFIGPYQIIRQLGKGSTATVYLAYDSNVDRQVAVKTYDPRFTHNPTFKTRFTNEAHILTSLEHDAIVPIYDFGIDDHWAYLVMRFMPGGSLKDVLQQGPLSLEESYRILQRVALALDLAHSHQVIHRDLKPQNILFDNDNQPYLADFGMARLAQETMSLQQTTVLGAPAYMSPEQVKGNIKVDHRADIYALGCILYEMLAGQPPFQGATTTQIMIKHARDPVPDILTFDPELPPGLNEIFQTALAKNPADRFPSATALVGVFYQQIIAGGTERAALSVETKQPEPALQRAQPATAVSVETAVSVPDTDSQGFFNKKTITLFVALTSFLLVFIFWALYQLYFIANLGDFGTPIINQQTGLLEKTTPGNSAAILPDSTPTNNPQTTTPWPSPTMTPIPPTATATKLAPLGRLALVSNRDGVDSIYLVDLTSSSPSIKLTGNDTNEFDDWWPSWCGQNTIVFERGRVPSEIRAHQELRSIRTDVISFGQTFVASAGENTMPGVPSCSLNGDFVAFSQQDNANDFVVRWAPFDTQSGRLSGASSDFGSDGFPHGGHISWANDDRHVVFMSTKGASPGNYLLYYVDKENIDPERAITWGFSRSSLFPDLSPDGNRIAYACVDVSNGYKVWDLCLTSVQNPAQVVLKPDLHPTPSPGQEALYPHAVTPSWSPDGEWVAYASDKDGDWDIYLFHVATNYEINLTGSWGSSDERQPSWGP
ncbi:MAG: serine/threonine-protein kinase [Chloroflexi bacterium]|nr:serine/threonine-protein kinase [Chloroflexota bacterium]MBP7044982.1 serine/threonine-protein kinase [Chloroflexota bacterium]